MNRFKVVQVASHRNGVIGAGFHVVTFRYREGREWRDMVAVRFDHDTPEQDHHRIAVLDTGLLPDVTFGVNSWRAETFVDFVDQAIRQWDAAETAKWAAIVALEAGEGEG